MTPSQLSAVLNRQAESVCKFLLPNGKRVHHEWMAGDTGGSAGRSLKIVLDGEKIGVWSDFSTGEVGGDLLDLWRVVMATGLYEAMQQAASWAGVQMDGLESRPQRSYKRPERPKNARRLNPTGKVMTYLKSRLLEDLTLEDFQIAEQDDEVVVFPYKRDGQLLNTKYLHIERGPDGKKKCWQESGTEPTLFGWQALERRYPYTRIVAITEGEIDCCTLHQYGIPALSIPNGGGGGKKQDWVENDYDYLNRFDTIYLCLDNDDAGKEAEKEIIRRLGSERCKTVTLPYKDANECLMKGMTNFNKFFLQAKTFDPIELKPADYFTEELIESFYPKPGTYQGMKSPWASFNQAMMFKRSELVVWSGYSGSGKALALDTPIATPEGWSNMGSIDVGDQVFDENGFVCNVVAKTDIMLNRPCYKVIFSDGCEIIADENHEWLTDTIQSRQSEAHARRNNRDSDRPLKKRGRDQSMDRRVKTIVTTKMIANTLVSYTGKDCSGVCVNHSIDVAGALILPHCDLPIDPYLLGVWLGDGTSQGAAITTADIEIVNEIVKVGFVVNKYASKYGYGIVGGFKKALDDNGLTNNKHIPDEYMRSSYNQRLALMQGLMDTDGYVSDKGRCEFCSTNKELGYQVLELSRTLGIRSYMVVGRAKLYGKDCGAKYRVMFSTDIPVFRLSRKSKNVCKSLSVGTRRRYIVSCESVESVPVRCIQVDSDSHLYLAGESMIPTHNSQMLGQVAIEGMSQGERFVICSLEMPSRETLKRMARQLTAEKCPSEARLREATGWLKDKLWMFNVVGKMKTERILEVFKYAVKRYGIRNFILDSLTKCNIREDDYEAQKEFVDALCDFNHRYEATTHLVVHQRKPSGNAERPDKFGARGAAAITDEASSVICVWRPSEPDEEEDTRFNNKKKAVKKDHHGIPVDSVLYIDKNRETGVEGKFNLFFDQDSLQFQESKTSVPIDYLARSKTHYRSDDNGTF